jgi:hypothetical protein
MRKIPVGISDFKELIQKNCAYIDKTLFIKELLEKEPKVALIPRMRRFGKTLNLSMLRYFFEKVQEDTSYLFTSLNIWKDEKYRAMQGQFPVIFLTLKDLKMSTWERTFNKFCGLISKEFNRHMYLLEGTILTQKEKNQFEAILFEKAEQALYEDSLLLLSEWLFRYYGKRVILLIDEYDTPAHSGFANGFYNELIPFLRNWLSAGLKDNSSLEFAVLTGILRVAKESIFSGLNNVSICTIFNKTFQDKFGLLESEVQELLQEYNLSHKLPEIKKWYNGYTIGSCREVYNPWSVLSCIWAEGIIASYWINTSDNALINQLITRGSVQVKKDFHELLQGKIIKKKIKESIVFSDLEVDTDALWSLLLCSGYVTITETSTAENCFLKIPNEEVLEYFRSLVRIWFTQSIDQDTYNLMLSSLTKGDIETFSEIFKKFIITTFSMFDITSQEPERVYHAFVLGILVGLNDSYEVKSNRESGHGRYDVILIPKDPHNLGIIMEFKRITSSGMSLEEAGECALHQIEVKQYATELLDRNVQRILYLGFAFEGKKVLIRSKFRD